MFSPSNKLFILVNTDYSLVKMTSYCLNPNLVCASLVLQSMITLVAYSLCKKILLSCVFGSSTNSYLCFPWPERNYSVVNPKFS